MSTITNPITALNSVLLKPNRVFQSLADTNNWSWLPFLLLSFVAAVSVQMYFNNVDFTWYVDNLIQQTMQNTSPAEQQMFRDTMNKDVASMGAVVMVLISPIIMNAILAAYLNAMTRNDDSHTHGFTDWYGAIWWTQMPSLVNAVIAMLLILLSSDAQIPAVYLNPLSLGFILGIEEGSSWFNLLIGLRLDLVWSIYLVAVCIAQWTQFDTRKSTYIAIGPYAVIYGIWLLILLFT